LGVDEGVSSAGAGAETVGVVRVGAEVRMAAETVGIKGNHVWSHDQGDRPNHVTKLLLGETG
jgi:hypothetical protein